MKIYLKGPDSGDNTPYLIIGYDKATGTARVRGPITTFAMGVTPDILSMYNYKLVDGAGNTVTLDVLDQLMGDV